MNRIIYLGGLVFETKVFSPEIGELTVYGNIEHGGLKLKKAFILSITIFIYGGGEFEGGGVKVFETISPVLPDLRLIFSFRNVLIDNLKIFLESKRGVNPIIVIGVTKYLENLKNFSEAEVISAEIITHLKRKDSSNKYPSEVLIKVAELLGMQSATQISFEFEE
jgi:hypothetical protein